MKSYICGERFQLSKSHTTARITDFFRDEFEPQEPSRSFFTRLISTLDQVFYLKSENIHTQTRLLNQKAKKGFPEYRVSRTTPLEIGSMMDPTECEWNPCESDVF